jgi:hypothetical protein
MPGMPWDRGTDYASTIMSTRFDEMAGVLGDLLPMRRAELSEVLHAFIRTPKPVASLLAIAWQASVRSLSSGVVEVAWGKP